MTAAQCINIMQVQIMQIKNINQDGKFEDIIICNWLVLLSLCSLLPHMHVHLVVNSMFNTIIKIAYLSYYMNFFLFYHAVTGTI